LSNINALTQEIFLHFEWISAGSKLPRAVPWPRNLFFYLGSGRLTFIYIPKKRVKKKLRQDGLKDARPKTGLDSFPDRQLPSS
jgi:hypothetical protein